MANPVLAHVLDLHVNPRVLNTRDWGEHTEALEALKLLHVDIKAALFAVGYEPVGGERLYRSEGVMLDEVPQACTGRTKKRRVH
jgi:hypothetical protein